MPRISKIRVSNIKLDKGTKIVGDKTFSLYGKNSLFLLENGGGKSSIIQLIHQVVLPNHEMQKRTMVGNVMKGNTIHVAVEWMPDEEHRAPIITGFCFKNNGYKRSANDRPYVYFNYIIETDYQGSYQLSELPFVVDGAVASYDVLRDKLKHSKGVRIFDTIKHYQEELESYGILASEWKNLSVVNSEEGGVTGFFEKAQTTRALVERLFVPYLMDSLYPTEEEKQELFEMFKSYKDELLKLPELEKNLRDYNELVKNSDAIIDSCKNYNELKAQVEDAQLMLARLYATLMDDSKKNQELQAETLATMNELDEKAKDLEWKLRSYTVHQLSEQAAKAKASFEEASVVLEKAEQQLAELNKEEQKQLAARSFGDYQKNSRLVNKLSAELRATQLEQNEKTKELEKLRVEVSEQYQYLSQDLLTKKRTLNEDLLAMKKKANQLTDAQQKRSSKRENNSNRIAVHQNTLDRYASELLKLKEQLLDIWKGEPLATKEDLASRVEQGNIEIQTLTEKTSEIEGKVRELIRKIERNYSEIKEKETEIQKADDEFYKYAEAEMKMNTVISTKLAVHSGDVFEDKQRIQQKMEHLTEQYSTQIINLSVEMEHLKQIRSVIEQKGYHTNSELESVKTFLAERNIEVVLGVEWLTKVVMDEKQKKALVRSHPLLPVSILAEDSQIPKLKRTLESYPHELTMPVIILNKANLVQAEEKEAVITMNDSTYVFHRFNVRLRAEEWEAYADNLEERLKTIESRRRELQGLSSDLDGYRRELYSFWAEYTPLSRQQLSNKVKGLKQEKVALEEARNTLEAQKNVEEDLLQQTKQAVLNATEIRNSYKEKLTSLESFLNRFSDINEVAEAKTALETENEQLIEEFTKAEEQLSSLKKEMEQANERISNLELKNQQLLRDKTEYEFQHTTQPREVTEEVYNQTKEAYKSFRETYSSDIRRVEELEMNLNNYRELMERAENDLSTYGYTPVEFGEVAIPFEQTLLDKIQAEQTSVQNDITKKAQAKNKAQMIMVRNDEKYLTEKGKTENTYGKDVYLYGPNAVDEKALFEKEMEQLTFEKEKAATQSANLRKRESGNQVAIDDLRESEDLFLNLTEGLDLLSEWNQANPIKDVRRIKKDIQTKRERLKDKKLILADSIRKLQDDVRKTNNATMLQLTIDLSRIIESDKDNYEDIIKNFVTVLEAMKAFEESLEIQRKETEQRRGALLELMMERAEHLYKNIKEIEKSSQIEEKGQITSLFTIHWPKKTPEVAYDELGQFVNDILQELSEKKKANVSSKELDDLFEKRMNMVNILNCYADIAKCSVKVLKFRNELLGKKEYDSWDVASKWSGGEQHATRVAMFIAMINHLRKKRFVKEMTWKFILLDNPFGAASSDHVVKPMVALAKKTNTQLFCLTGIKDKNIQSEFDTVISNQYVLQRGALFLDTETTYKDSASAEAAEMDSLFYSTLV